VTRARARRQPARIDPLAWIVAFKAFKAATLTALGISLLVTRHADPADILLRLAVAVHLPLTSRLLNRLLAFAANLTITRQTALAVTAFAYATLMATEGVALYLRKHWARWFTIGATSSLVPIEIYEIVREVHPVRVLVLVANIVIVVYLFERREMFEASR
jgi:uncharacterized membrane protein (DUF2068 family)